MPVRSPAGLLHAVSPVDDVNVRLERLGTCYVAVATIDIAIGSHLVDRLVAEGWAVTVLDDFSTGARANLADAQSRGEVRIVEGSILDPQAIEAAMAGSEVVFHLAVRCVRRSLGEPLHNHEVNATGTLNVLEVARRRQVGRFIYCSSSEVYGNCGPGPLVETATVCEPATVYGAAKLAGEHYAKA